MGAIPNDGTPHRADDGVFYRKDGSSFQAEYWCNPIERDGETIGTVLGFLDITERRKTKTSLRLLSLAIQQSDQRIRKPSPPKTILKAVHKALGAGQTQQTIVPAAVTTAATASIQPNQTNSLAQ